MSRYILRRVLIAIPTLIGITILIFIAMRILPGDPLSMIMSESTGKYVLSDEELAQARASLGLDKPLHVQYLAWMGEVLRGDLGSSFWTKEPIRDLILRRGPITIQIALMAVIFSWLVGVLLGMLSALWRNSWLDYLSRMAITVFIAVPSFWVGLLIILFTVLVFTWRPPLSIVQFWEDPIANLSMTLLPAFALGLGLAASQARLARSSALEVLFEDYVRTARAKGLREQMVLVRDGLKNAFIPVLTIIGIQLGALLGGSIIIEQIFGLPGIGWTMIQAIFNRDYPVVQVTTLFLALIFVLINLLVDLTYATLDPRIKYT